MDKQKPAPTLETAVDLESKGEYISAAQMFKELGMLERAIDVSLKPQGFQSPKFKFAAETALELGDMDRTRRICEEGMRHFEKSCEDSHDSGDLPCAADLALLLKDYDKAISYHKHLDTFYGYLRCARISKESGNTGRTKRFYDLALKKAIIDYEKHCPGSPCLFEIYDTADEMGDTETADKFYKIIVQACEKEVPSRWAANIAEKRKDFKRAIEYYKKADCLGNAARVAHITSDTSSVFTSESHLFDMIIDRFKEWRSGPYVREAYYTGSETKFTLALDWKGRRISTAVNEDEMVEADETYWRALFTKARNYYLRKHEYDESKRFKAKLDGDCNIGKANVYKVLNQVLN